MTKEDQNLNDNGSMSKRKLDRNSVNAPGMIDYDKLKATLGHKSRPDESIWGFVNNQQKLREKKAQSNTAPGGNPSMPNSVTAPNPGVQNMVQQEVQAQFPKTGQLMMLLQDNSFKTEVKAAQQQESMTGKPNPMLLSIKGQLKTLGLA